MSGELAIATVASSLAALAPHKAPTYLPSNASPWGRSASTEILTILLRAVGLVGPRKNLAGNTIANDNAIALAA